MTVLALLGVSFWLRSVVETYQTVFNQMELKELPIPTELALLLGPYLWVAVVPAAVEGLRRMLKSDSTATLSWLLIAIFGFIGLAAVMTFFLYMPVAKMNGQLSK